MTILNKSQKEIFLEILKRLNKQDRILFYSICEKRDHRSLRKFFYKNFPDIPKNINLSQLIFSL